MRSLLCMANGAGEGNSAWMAEVCIVYQIRAVVVDDTYFQGPVG